MNKISQTFEENTRSVTKLIDFDRVVLDLAIGSVQKLHDRLVQPPFSIESDRSNGKRTLDNLKHIRTNDSLKLYYSTINNQAIVLLVSYFGSAVTDLFRLASLSAVKSRKEASVLNTELKIKVKELLEFQEDDNNSIGNILIEKSSISFQDMKSIHREFKNYFGIEIEKSENVNNIILSQACRHSIVHEGAIVNNRVLNQIRGAIPRGIKHDLQLDEKIEFSKEEIRLVTKCMLEYVTGLESSVLLYGESI